ncbi:DUF580-domain-containing protein [Coniophora puteana RWD-64-598 SS2]|uniref:Protein PNS1 n=1 Tax=Coniophora puteana (strain RWD-64-598) TaxID=741705 RepID=A0A5M3MRY0_CONPW|nr:DUF580-domain-containing protein [Coniophora puteana RWD-64-598 SS2]EIW81912.1 DUF580-domain-containing protein [Coniophora puteana RWD-64-598 SS2]
MAEWDTKNGHWIQMGDQSRGSYQPLNDPAGYQPGLSQPYAPPYAGGPPSQTAYGGYQGAGGGGGGGGGYGAGSPWSSQRFKPEKKVQNPIVLILFLAQFIGFIGLSAWVIYGWIKDGGLSKDLNDANDKGVTLNKQTLYLLLAVTGAALVISTIFLLIVRIFTKAILHITMIFSILLNVAFAGYLFYMKVYVGAIIGAIAAVLSVLVYFGIWKRIPFASLMLKVVLDVSKHHLAVYVVAFAGLFVQMLLCVVFVFAAVATYEKWSTGSDQCKSSNSCSDGKVAGVIAFEAVSFIWNSQVVGNVALATMAGGPFGCWYYFGPSNMGGMPSFPTLSAFGRASTFSLGSIAMGSLIVTILEVIRLLLNALRNSAQEDGNPCLWCLACCAECFVSWFESMVEYFNRYAYIQIALYGKPYVRAAKDTWRMFKDRGIDALVNDSLVNHVIAFGGYCVGLLCALLSYLYLHFDKPSYNSDGSYTAPVMIFGFLIGLMCSLTLGTSIEAGVSTIFVGLGEDPQVLAIRSPELFAAVAATYPQVVRGVGA